MVHVDYCAATSYEQEDTPKRPISKDFVFSSRPPKGTLPKNSMFTQVNISINPLSYNDLGKFQMIDFCAPRVYTYGAG